MPGVVEEIRGDSSSGLAQNLWLTLTKSNANLEKDFLDLSSSNFEEVATATNNIFNEIIKTQQFYKEQLLNSEAASHGFLHGAVEMNFLYRYALTTRVEPILGTGEGRGDFLLLSRLGIRWGELTNRSWNNAAILVEIKKEGTDVKTASDQTGKYVLGGLSLRTVREEIISVGYVSSVPIGDPVKTEIKKIESTQKDFIKMIFNLLSKKTDEVKNELIKELQNSNFNQLDKIIAGQLTVPFSMLFI